MMLPASISYQHTMHPSDLYRAAHALATKYAHDRNLPPDHPTRSTLRAFVEWVGNVHGRPRLTVTQDFSSARATIAIRPSIRCGISGLGAVKPERKRDPFFDPAGQRNATRRDKMRNAVPTLTTEQLNALMEL